MGLGHLGHLGHWLWPLVFRVPAFEIILRLTPESTSRIRAGQSRSEQVREHTIYITLALFYH